MLRIFLGLLILLSGTVAPAWADEPKKVGWVCGSCNGSGKIFKKCSKCKETGICPSCKNERIYVKRKGLKGKECRSCRGKGYRDFGGSKTKECRTCKGKGILPCRKCKGSGKCVACTGSGKVPKENCSVCKGTGGKWRDPGLADLVRQNGGSVTTECAVLAGLTWLARHQHPDGSWGVKTFQNQCQGDTKCSGTGEHESVDIGLTGLSLLAFAGANYSPGSKDVHEGICFGDVVSKAAVYLKNAQQKDGAFCRMVGKPMYYQAVAVYALAELVDLMKTQGENPASFHQAAQKGATVLLEGRNPGEAWRYTPKCGDNDVSVTSWCFQALKAAQKIGSDIPNSVWAGVKSHLDKVTDEQSGKVGYVGRQGIGVMGRIEEKLFNDGKLYVAPTLTAAGIAMRLAMKESKQSAVIDKGVSLLRTSLPTWDTSLRGKIDYYYWYHGSYALYKYDGPDGSVWQQWNEVLKKILLEHQKTASDGCAEGSWGSADRWSEEAGRVYATAINVLTLEVYYRAHSKK